MTTGKPVDTVVNVGRPAWGGRSMPLPRAHKLGNITHCQNGSFYRTCPSSMPSYNTACPASPSDRAGRQAAGRRRTQHNARYGLVR